MTRVESLAAFNLGLFTLWRLRPFSDRAFMNELCLVSSCHPDRAKRQRAARDSTGSICLNKWRKQSLRVDPSPAPRVDAYGTSSRFSHAPPLLGAGAGTDDACGELKLLCYPCCGAMQKMLRASASNRQGRPVPLSGDGSKPSGVWRKSAGAAQAARVPGTGLKRRRSGWRLMSHRAHYWSREIPRTGHRVSDSPQVRTARSARAIRMTLMAA